MIKTHKNFKSIDSKIRDAETLNFLIGEALKSQANFKRWTPIGETYFNNTNLKSFKVDLENVDRLYHINYRKDGDAGIFFIVLGRMDYNGKAVFFELSINFDISNIYNSVGYIFISTDANIFIKSVSDHEYPFGLIEWSLYKDGIEIDVDIEQYYNYYFMIEMNIPPFKNMSNLNSNDLEERLCSMRDDLDEYLYTKIDSFIEFVELKQHYEKMLDD